MNEITETNLLLNTYMCFDIIFTTVKKKIKYICIYIYLLNILEK